MAGCPFPKDIIDNTRVVTRYNTTLGSFANNASKTSIVSSPSDEEICLCDQLRLVAPDDCFRNGHFASDSIDAVLRFFGIEPDQPDFDQTRVVWYQGAKFRSAICVDAAVKRLESDIDRYVDAVKDDLPICLGVQKKGSVGRKTTSTSNWYCRSPTCACHEIRDVNWRQNVPTD